MFEIGTSLRQARERRQLDLSQVADETRIPRKFLLALEDEQFERLPAAAYARGFLRSYADFLGLDAQRFVDEYNGRFAPTDEPQAAPPVRIQRPGHLRSRLLVIVPAALVLGLVAWGFSRGTGHHHARVAKSPPLPHTLARTTTPAPTAPAARPSRARIAFVATRGPCWLSVRLGSATGSVVYERTLAQGQTVNLSGTSLWIRIGAPWNLDAKLNGKPVVLPASVGNVVATARGLQPG